MSLQVCRAFYEQPLEQRLALAAVGGPNFLGYLPSEAECAESAPEWPSFSGTRARGYSSYDYVADPRVFDQSGLTCRNKWPVDPTLTYQVRTIQQALYRFTHLAAIELFKLIDDEFGSVLSRRSIEGGTCSMLRLLHYDAEQDAVSKAHTDYEFLAVLVCNEPGLEIEREPGGWHKVPSTPDGCILLPGDMTNIASGGHIPATRHRVSYGTGKRNAVVAFQGLKYGTTIPYPGLKSHIKFGEHICGLKVRGTPHLESALNSGELKLTFEVPLRNPLGLSSMVAK
jgi:isopenicillin N synthase-like dioxygenase